MAVHPFIEAEKRAGHSVERACELMKVFRTAFYARRSALPGPRAVRGAELTEQITEVHARSRGTYGVPRDRACRAHTRGRWVWPVSCRTTGGGRGTAGPAPRAAAGGHDPGSQGPFSVGRTGQCWDNALAEKLIRRRAGRRCRRSAGEPGRGGSGGRRAGPAIASRSPGVDRRDACRYCSVRLARSIADG